jgi:hypothetical protein
MGDKVTRNELLAKFRALHKFTPKIHSRKGKKTHIQINLPISYRNSKDDTLIEELNGNISSLPI